MVYALTHEVAQHRAPDSEKLGALFDFVKVLVDFFPKESVLLPYLTRLLSVKSRITRGEMRILCPILNPFNIGEKVEISEK